MYTKIMSKSQYENEFWTENVYRKENKFEDEDKHYHKLSYPYPCTINNIKYPYTVKHFYSSGDKGSYIRDAITGYYYSYKVGSKEEDLFFKVRLCHKNFNKRVITCFYQTPQDFEENHFAQLKDDTILAWEYKYSQYKHKSQ